MSWNVADLLKECLRSIERWRTPGDSYQVIVVDNRSTDDTVAMVRSEFPGITLVANSENAGFARSNNQAFSLCTGEFVLLLNPDTEVREGAIGGMVTFLRAHPEYGAVGPKLVSTEGNVWFEGARNLPAMMDLVSEAFLLRRLFPRSKVFGRLLISYWDHASDRDVECLQGACMLVRRSVIGEIGPLDETLFMYFEDVDFCCRIRRAGWKIRYLADAVVLHVWQGSTRQSPEKEERMVKLTYQSYYVFFRKYKGRVYAEIARVLAVAGGLFRILLFSVAGAGRPAGRRKGFLMIDSMRPRELRRIARE